MFGPSAYPRDCLTSSRSSGRETSARPDSRLQCRTAWRRRGAGVRPRHICIHLPSHSFKAATHHRHAASVVYLRPPGPMNDGSFNRSSSRRISRPFTHQSNSSPGLGSSGFNRCPSDMAIRCSTGIASTSPKSYSGTLPLLFAGTGKSSFSRQSPAPSISILIHSPTYKLAFGASPIGFNVTSTAKVSTRT